MVVDGDRGLRRDTAERRAATAQARLIEKVEASGYSAASGVNPLACAALVNRLSASQECLMMRPTRSSAPSMHS
jgi:hypothetical protein